MKRTKNEVIRAEYDFSKGVRGKYFKKYQAGTNVVLLSADVQKVFPDSEAVNRALRVLIKTARKVTKSASL